MSEKTLQMTLLFDVYGDLLTDKQREYFDLYYNEDYSLSEIAENAGITRQGAHDILLRAENTLTETERRTGLIARFEEIRRKLETASALTGQIAGAETLTQAKALAGELAGILRELKG